MDVVRFLSIEPVEACPLLPGVGEGERMKGF
jgi:hypothetical protein